MNDGDTVLPNQIIEPEKEEKLTHSHSTKDATTIAKDTDIERLGDSDIERHQRPSTETDTTKRHSEGERGTRSERTDGRGTRSEATSDFGARKSIIKHGNVPNSPERKDAKGRKVDTLKEHGITFPDENGRNVEEVHEVECWKDYNHHFRPGGGGCCTIL